MEFFNMGAGPQYATAADAAAAVGLSEVTVRRLVSGGTCPGYFDGRQWHVDFQVLVETAAALSVQRGAVEV